MTQPGSVGGRPNILRVSAMASAWLGSVVADDYIVHVARSLLDWGDSSRATPRALTSYDEWLVQTGRQETGARGVEVAWPISRVDAQQTNSWGCLAGDLLLVDGRARPIPSGRAIPDPANGA